MKKLKEHTKQEYKKALVKAYKEWIKDISRLDLKKECIDKYVCPNCLKGIRCSTSEYIIQGSECGFSLTYDQYDKLFEKIF